jgi:predicted SprT family Zn-dependent metalloprotease
MTFNHLVNLDAQVKARFVEVWARFVRLYPQLSSYACPSVELSNRMTATAGKNLVEQNRIVLARKFFTKPENYGEMMRVVIPHEIAHQVAVNLYGMPKNNRWHGGEWQSVMIRYGLPPDTYHNMVI